MPSPGIEVEGLAELRKALRRAKDSELNDTLKAVHKRVAEMVSAAAEPNIPVRSGDLRRSLRSSGTLAGAVGRVGRKSVPYAAAVHWGRKRGNVGRPPGNRRGPNAVRKNPFLRDAAQRLEPEVQDEMQEAIQEMFDRLIRDRPVLRR